MFPLKGLRTLHKGLCGLFPEIYQNTGTYYLLGKTKNIDKWQSHRCQTLLPNSSFCKERHCFLTNIIRLKKTLNNRSLPVHFQTVFLWHFILCIGNYQILFSHISVILNSIFGHLKWVSLRRTRNHTDHKKVMFADFATIGTISETQDILG